MPSFDNSTACSFGMTIKLQHSYSVPVDVLVQVLYDNQVSQSIVYTNVPSGLASWNIYNENLDALIRKKGGKALISAIFDYNSSSSSLFTFTPSQQLSNQGFELLLNNNSAIDGIVAAQISGVTCDELRLKAIPLLCGGGSMSIWSLTVTASTFGTYNNASTNKTGALSTLEVNELLAGTFDLNYWYTAIKSGTWSANTLYDVNLIGTATGGIWASKTIWLSLKLGKETYLRDYKTEPMGTNPFTINSRYAAFPIRDLGFEQNRLTDVKVGTCVDHRISLYESPDIWNTYASTTYIPAYLDQGYSGAHKNPDMVSSSTNNPNYLYTAINNQLCETSAALNVRMFWTRARTGEKWPKDWLYDLSNNYVNDIYSNKQPGGSEITLSGVSYSNWYQSSVTNSNPVSISAGVPAFGSGKPGVIVTGGVAWYPPNPDWYDAQNGSMSGDNKPIICLLSRINESTSSNDPIVYEPGSGINFDIDPYIRWNNNVATKNTELINELNPLAKPLDDDDILWGRFHTAIVNNPSGHAMRVCYRDLNKNLTVLPALTDYAELHVGFTEGLWNNWVSNGMHGSGFEVLASTLVRVTNYDSVCFDSITIGDSTTQQIGIRMVYNAYNLPVNDTPIYNYVLYQTNMPSAPAYKGSDVIVHWELTYPAELDEQVEMRQMGQGKPESTKETLKNKIDRKYKKDYNKSNENLYQSSHKNSELSLSHISIYPNPSQSYFDISTVGYYSPKAVLYNISGAMIENVNLNKITDDVYFARLNINELPKGIYILKMYSSNKIELKKLIVE